eukprot:860628-Amphidinium_carterae.1
MAMMGKWVWACLGNLHPDKTGAGKLSATSTPNSGLLRLAQATSGQLLPCTGVITWQNNISIRKGIKHGRNG